MKRGIFKIAFLDCVRHSRSNLKIFALLTFVFVLLMTCLGYIFTLDFNIGNLLNEEENRGILIWGESKPSEIYPIDTEAIAQMKHVEKVTKSASAYQNHSDDEITVDDVPYAVGYVLDIDFWDEKRLGEHNEVVGRMCKVEKEFVAYSSALSVWGITDYASAIGKNFAFYTMRSGEKLFRNFILTGVIDDGKKNGRGVKLIMPESEFIKLPPMSKTNLIKTATVIVTVDDYMRKEAIMRELAKANPKCFVTNQYADNSDALRNIKDHRKLMLCIFGVVGGLAAFGLLLCAGVAVFNDDCTNKWRYGAMMAQGMQEKDAYLVSFLSRFMLTAAASVIGAAVSVPAIYGIKIVMGEMFGVVFALNVGIIIGAFAAAFLSLAAVCALCVPALKAVLKNKSILSILKGR